jgi:hypothetical protein
MRKPLMMKNPRLIDKPTSLFVVGGGLKQWSCLIVPLCYDQILNS